MRYAFVLTGQTSLIMHADDVEQSDELSAWRKDPKNKSTSVAGDDRSPPWSWQTYIYHNAGVVGMPQECIMAALRFAGAKIPGQGRSTLKSLSQSGLVITSSYCKLTQRGREVRIADIVKIRDQPFASQKKSVEALGFGLLVKRAAVGTSKHVRVRPIFDEWTVSGELDTLDPAINESVLNQMFEIAGNLAGLGDWRPSAPKKPGPYGMFGASIRKA